MALGEVNLEILADGTVKWKTGRIPGEHHDDADDMLRELADLLGGDIDRERQAARPGHVHTHGETHVHEHGDHSH